MLTSAYRTSIAHPVSERASGGAMKCAPSRCAATRSPSSVAWAYTLGVRRGSE